MIFHWILAENRPLSNWRLLLVLFLWVIWEQHKFRPLFSVVEALILKFSESSNDFRIVLRKFSLKFMEFHWDNSVLALATLSSSIFHWNLSFQPCFPFVLKDFVNVYLPSSLFSRWRMLQSHRRSRERRIIRIDIEVLWKSLCVWPISRRWRIKCRTLKMKHSCIYLGLRILGKLF